jgi:hypothetical protein
MKLISTELGRVVRLVPADEYRPIGGFHGPTGFRLLAERYSFGYSPDLRRPWDELNKEGFKFQQGKFVHGNKTINVTDFTIYPDGLVVTAFTTDEAELFLSDVLAWGKEVFGIRDAVTDKHRTLYLSHVVIEFGASPNVLLNGFSRISERLSGLLHSNYGITAPVQLSSLCLNYDKTETPAWANIAQFVLERRVNQPYAANRFYSEAPLRTLDHLAFLEVIEAVFSATVPSPSKKTR